MEDDRDFRTYSIIPTYEELVFPKRKYEAKKNIIDGPFADFDNYLATQFWLLRDDLLVPLRETVQKLIREEELEYRNDSMCRKVKFLRPSSEYDCHTKKAILCFDPDKKWFRLDENTERSKFLMTGSLLCFTCNGFNTLLFATVSCRNHDYLFNTQILVEFREKYDEDIFNKDYIMIESEAYFEPYNHVLKALQNISYSFPFQDYLVDVVKEDFLPQYLKQNGDPDMITVKGVAKDYTFNIWDLNTWPSAPELGLNNSQHSALKSALTKEFAVIHGPPGTGKTFLALKIIEILTRNKLVLKKKTPILVISYTNCALDQILVGALEITNKVVRIGKQSRRKELERYNFDNLQGSRQQRFEGLAQQDIIGVTTTRAARMRSELMELGCEVVIVEEAATVFEAHVLACLSEKCQHLILIGDHKQLGPQVSHKELARLDLDISLFERMMRNRKVNCCTLDVQYRMAPEMVKLLSPLFYDDLKSDISVNYKPDLRILTKRVSFVTHDFSEELELDYRRCAHFHEEPYRGKMNEHEAEFVVALANYLLICGDYTSRDVTILTVYNDQVLAIKEIIKDEKREFCEELAKVKVLAVDDFHGGESRIIILSLVRSNGNGIGFLDHPNRVAAALSKARDGIVIIGNMNHLSYHGHHTMWQNADKEMWQNADKEMWQKADKEMLQIADKKMWQNIKTSLAEQGALADSLVVSCAKHPENRIAVKQPEDFDRLCPNGDCSSEVGQLCKKFMSCGHKCQGICQPICDHSSIPCQEPCHKLCKARLHRCAFACHFDCSSCKEMVEFTYSCGHKRIVACSETTSGASSLICTKCETNLEEQAFFDGVTRQLEECKVQCDGLLPCGHNCKAHHHPGSDHPKNCIQPCNKNCRGGLHLCRKRCHGNCVSACLMKVEVPLSCGSHKKTTACWQTSLDADNFCEICQGPLANRDGWGPPVKSLFNKF